MTTTSEYGKVLKWTREEHHVFICCTVFGPQFEVMAMALNVETRTALHTITEFSNAIFMFIYIDRKNYSSMSTQYHL